MMQINRSHVRKVDANGNVIPRPVANDHASLMVLQLYMAYMCAGADTLND